MTEPRMPRSQRGWVGLVALLLALLIVAWLSMSALKGYGLTGKPAADPTPAGTVPADPRARARAAESIVIEGAKEQAKRIDEAEQGK